MLSSMSRTLVCHQEALGAGLAVQAIQPNCLSMEERRALLSWCTEAAQCTGQCVGVPLDGMHSWPDWSPGASRRTCPRLRLLPIFLGGQRAQLS